MLHAALTPLNGDPGNAEELVEGVESRELLALVAERLRLVEGLHLPRLLRIVPRWRRSGQGYGVWPRGRE